MAWTKKTGTLPDKIKTLIVVDATDGKIKDLGDSGNIEGTNISRSNATFVVNVDRTSDAYGIGVYTGMDTGLFIPGEIQFTAAAASRPKWIATATGGTVVWIFNRKRAADSLASHEFCLMSDANQPILRCDASSHGQIGASEYTTASTGTTVIPNDTPFGIAMYAKRSATADWKYFYGTKAGGTFTQEGSVIAINDAGGTSTLNKLGTNNAGQVIPYELFMLAVAPTDLLSGAEINSILADPVGTLINTNVAPPGPPILYRRGPTFVNDELILI